MRGERVRGQRSEMGGPAEDTQLPLFKDRVSTYSNHGLKPGVGGSPAAKINQDRGQITYPLAVRGRGSFDNHRILVQLIQCSF